MMREQEETKMTDWQNLTKKERRRLKKEQKQQKKKQETKKRRLIKWSIVSSLVVLLVGGVFLSNYLKSKRFANASRIEVTPVTFDFGKVSLKEKKQTSFLIKNTGASPLILSGARTSCDCTTAQFKIGEKESPVFGMHDPPTWSTTLEAGKTGELVVFYEPQVHPVTGPVTREVYIFSNDPWGKEKKVTIYADVQQEK